MKYFIHLPMKMEPIASSETSAIKSQTPGNYPKRNKLHLQHGESLRTRSPEGFLSFRFMLYVLVGQDSSVGIAICYGLGGPGDRIPAGTRFFAHVQTAPGANPASCTMGAGSFPAVKRSWCGVDHPPPPN